MTFRIITVLTSPIFSAVFTVLLVRKSGRKTFFPECTEPVIRIDSTLNRGERFDGRKKRCKCFYRIFMFAQNLNRTAAKRRKRTCLYNIDLSGF